MCSLGSVGRLNMSSILHAAPRVGGVPRTGPEPHTSFARPWSLLVQLRLARRCLPGQLLAARFESCWRVGARAPLRDGEAAADVDGAGQHRRGGQALRSARTHCRPLCTELATRGTLPAPCASKQAQGARNSAGLAAAPTCAAVWGSRPPPASIMPPTAVSPLTALVTLMSGECSACATPHTVWYPAGGPPRARTPHQPHQRAAASRAGTAILAGLGCVWCA